MVVVVESPCLEHFSRASRGELCFSFLGSGMTRSNGLCGFLDLAERGYHFGGVVQERDCSRRGRCSGKVGLDLSDLAARSQQGAMQYTICSSQNRSLPSLVLCDALLLCMGAGGHGTGSRAVGCRLDLGHRRRLPDRLDQFPISSRGQLEERRSCVTGQSHNTVLSAIFYTYCLATYLAS
ncbi:hypothetical protein LZ32DRAFT_80632 [Colletotrichum eremochloae]|nr:hypothetical protein LZ32DRAFT_80632 [Colletotrichum eremochloae]